MEATIHVYTYRAGLLARLAHDLRFTVWRHELSVQGRHVRGHCDADAFRVDGVVTARGLDKRRLSFNDRQMITTAIREDVLHIAEHPRVEFDGEVTGDMPGPLQLAGTLHLHGQSRGLRAPVEVRADRLCTTFELRPSDFGVPRFKALGGAITVRNRVRVAIEIALEGLTPEGVLGSHEAMRVEVAED